MDDMNEPRRLWQDDGASPALRAALRAGRDDKAGAARLAAMAAGLGAAGVPVAQAAAVSGMALGTKLTLAIAIVSGLGGPAYFVMSRKPRMQEAPAHYAVDDCPAAAQKP